MVFMVERLEGKKWVPYGVFDTFEEAYQTMRIMEQEVGLYDYRVVEHDETVNKKYVKAHGISSTDFNRLA